MSVTSTLTTRGVRANKARFILTAVAVIVGVGFVSGSFLLTASLRDVFNGVSEQIAEGIDVQVRREVTFGERDEGNPVPRDLIDTVSAVPGVARADGGVQALGVTVIKADGKALIPNGPVFAVGYTGNPQSPVQPRDGRAPEAGEIGFDITTFEQAGYAIGDTVEILTPTGRRQFTLAGNFTFGNRNNLGGAALVGFDLDTASELFAAGGYTTIDVTAEPGQDRVELARQVDAALPDGFEAIDQDALIQETKDQFNGFINQFGTALLVFAFIALFVSAFLINNTFAIVAQQRVRELAMLRAVGASQKQVRRMMIGEALVIGVFSSVVGFGVGWLVAIGIKALLAAGGADLPGGIVFTASAVIAALVVGIGVTLISALGPARRASTVPPVAAISGNHSFEIGNARRRLVLSGLAAGLGLAVLCFGLFATPGGVPQTLSTAGAGALVLFLGIAGLSRLIARPVVLGSGRLLSTLVSFPAALLGRGRRDVAARLAREDAARQPRRTAATASALMIGLALVSAVGVLGSSLKATLRAQLEELVSADVFVNDRSFTGFPASVVTDLQALPGIASATGIRIGEVQVAGDTKSVTAADPVPLGEMLDLKITEGSLADLNGDTLFVHEDPASDLGLSIGSTVDVTFPSSGTKPFTVVGIFSDSTVTGSNWLMNEKTFAENFQSLPNVFLAAATYAPDADLGELQLRLLDLETVYPNVEVQDRTQFRKAQESQVDILLNVINALLLLAVVIAVIGIANTLALSVFERTREIGLLRAVGMTRKQVKRNVRWESTLVAMFGSLLGIVVGILIGVLVTQALPSAVISSVALPVGSFVLYLVLAVLAGVIAAFFPARRAAKMNVLAAIAHE